jgi:tripeptide aminopeptidase
VISIKSLWYWFWLNADRFLLIAPLIQGFLVMAKASAADPAQIDEKAALKLVTEMMAIPGKSCEERPADFLRKKLAAAGVPRSAVNFDDACKRSPVGGEIGNLIVKLPGTVRGPHAGC